MDEKTLQALTALAMKLGTTVEYLWGVLVKQAPISGVTDLLLIGIWVTLATLWVRFVINKTTRPKTPDRGSREYPEWEGEAKFFAWLSVFVAVGVTVLAVSSSIPTAIAALFNPEYWAFRQVWR